jgi:PIN domain nuclease of toxin-antitoxin system
MKSVVLDTSAIFAFLQREAGSEQVEECLQSYECLMSTINLAELVGTLTARGATGAGIEELLAAIPLEYVPFDSDQARACGQLTPFAREAGLSLGDRACLSLAQSRGIPVITADRAWLKPRLQIEVRCIREP